MNKEYEEKIEKLKKHLRKIEYLRFLSNGLLYWDKITKMPSKGSNYRSETMSFIAGEMHKLSEDKEFISLVSELSAKDPEEFDFITNSMLRKIRRSYEYVNKIPGNEYTEYIYLIAKTEEVWLKSKKSNDFEAVIPYLEKVVEHFRNFTEYWGYEQERYDAFLSYYETGLNTKKLDEIFMKLKAFIIDLLNKIKNSNIQTKDIFKGNFDKKAQATMANDILERIGFDFEAGRLDEGEHPTILTNCNNDVRIIINFNENDIRPAFTTALHEGGQALYEQGINSDLYGTSLAEPSSLVILEAVARFYENIFGRSKEFWDFYYPIFKKYFSSYRNISKKSFYEAINMVEPTLIRMDADELTYNLHVIIRYEIEKDLINNKLNVKDIPAVWNQKYKDYLGIEPSDYDLGVLQDVHWFSGYFGYFPNYILGNINAAQLYYTIKRDLPDYDQIVSSGNWGKINEWFKEKIFTYGSIYNPQELIYLITDEKLNEDYFINYLKEKYEFIYEINN